MMGGTKSWFGRGGEDKSLVPVGIRIQADQPVTRRYSE
jgi:hypothetical protein